MIQPKMLDIKPNIFLKWFYVLLLQKLRTQILQKR